MSEENKVIDKVNTSEIVEQLVETEAIPPLNTEPTHPLQPLNQIIVRIVK